MLYRQETVVAISTSLGYSALAIVRISGNQSFAVGSKILATSGPVEEKAHSSIFHTWVRDPETLEPIDEVLVSVFKAPHSFTGEDMLEISCHGGFVSPNRILELCLKHGCVLAEPGEFTQRAVLNKKYNLNQAEAIYDIIHAPSHRAAQLAIQNLKNSLARTLEPLRENILHLLSKIEVSIDFSEDAIDGIDWTFEDTQSIAQTHYQLTELRKIGERSEKFVQGFQVLLIGKPNAGKSSLFNILAGKEKAIVSSIAGTTRDSLDILLQLGNFPIKLIDSAGLRHSIKKEGSQESLSHEDLEMLGIEKTKSLFQSTDVFLCILDSTDPSPMDLLDNFPLPPEQKTIFVYNKSDLPASPAIEKMKQTLPGVEISCTQALGLTELWEQIEKSLKEIDHDPVQFYMNQRIQQLTQKLLEELDSALQILETESAVSWELVSFHLHRFLELMAEIEGNSVGEDVWEHIFANFCLGK